MQLKPGKNIRLFENPVLEMMTFVHPLMPIGLWGPIIGYCLYRGLMVDQLGWATLGLFMGGFFIWTLTEYLLHRFMFHYVPRSKAGDRFIFLIHGIHHDDPDDQRRLLMPPVPAILLAAIFYGLFILTLGTQMVNPFFAGFLVGYLAYDYVHFFTHFGRYQSGWMKTLQRNHMTHHFRTDGKLYGVSNPLWDYVFKTKV